MQNAFSKEIEVAKRTAAKKALELILSENYESIGVGTGSTVAHFIEELSKAINDLPKCTFVASSLDTFLSLTNRGFRNVLLCPTTPHIDVYIDGADEVCRRDLSMIKGGGGALVREKILASMSRRNIIIVDHTKIVEHLGEKHPVPVEVVPFALPLVLNKLSGMNLNPKVRYSVKKRGPVISDNGNIIIDAYTGAIPEPKALEEKIKRLPGVVDVGIFVDLADYVIIGYPDETTRVLSR